MLLKYYVNQETILKAMLFSINLNKVQDIKIMSLESEVMEKYIPVKIKLNNIKLLLNAFDIIKIIFMI